MSGAGSAQALLILFTLSVVPAAAGEASRSGAEFEVSGHVSRRGEGAMAGGAFVLSAVGVPASAARGGDYAVTPALALGDFQSPSGSLCFCGSPLFADGFESGGTGFWSAAFP